MYRRYQLTEVTKYARSGIPESGRWSNFAVSVSHRGWSSIPLCPLSPEIYHLNFLLSSLSFPYKAMSPLRLFCSHSGTNTGVCFESIIARSWYMAHGTLSHADLDELGWLSLILSDNNKVRIALLHVEYSHHCSQIMGDHAALATLEEQYHKLQCSITPISRLPVEILREIFYIALDVGEPRTGLTHVCWRWHKTIEGMSNAWTSLKLRACTAPESVQQLLHRAGRQPLIVEIDWDDTGNIVEDLNLSLAIAAKSASQWETLTITSLPQSDQGVRDIHDLFSFRLQPMNQLQHLRIMHSASSPLLNRLLQIVAKSAVAGLASAEIHSPLAIQCFLQPSQISIFDSLTTFSARLPKMSEPFDLLPHFNQLEVLELTNILLPLYGSRPLPLVDTLHHLLLRAVSIQWMEGQVFPRLKRSTIINPPIRSHPLVLDVTLPACVAFQITNKNISLIRKFQMVNVDSLVVTSNQWSAGRAHEQMAHLLRAVFETPLKLHALHLSIPCKEKILLAMLSLLPSMEELKIDLPRPSALSKHFFKTLLAKPDGQVDWKQLNELKKGKGWRAVVCPHLRIMELKYRQWLRQSDDLDFVAPLFAMAWSRARTATPLKLNVHFKSSHNSWKSFELTAQSSMTISRLEIPSLLHLDGPLSFDLLYRCFVSVTHLPLKISTWNRRDIYGTSLFSLCCRHLQVLKIDGHGEILNVLPSFQQLKELSLTNVKVPPLTRSVYLHLVHTLKTLSLCMSSLSWMDGRVFVLLESFAVDEDGWPLAFERGVEMPACTHIVFRQHNLKMLPILQSNFQFPFLDRWEFVCPWEDSRYDKRGISALQSIHAKAFYFQIWGNCQQLLGLLESKEEMEQLELQFGISVHLQDILARLSVVNQNTKRVSCSNMKVLGLQCSRISFYTKDIVAKWCMKMMDKRKLAGYPMEKCCIWWSGSREGGPPLVLIAE